MPIPQPVTDALNKLAADRADLDGMYAAKSSADAALAAATNTQATAANALAGGIATFEGDKGAALKLIAETMNSGPPTPVTAPVPSAGAG